MAEAWLSAYLKHILLNLMSSPEIKLAGEQLHILNHLAMIRDSLWAINAVMVDAIVRALKEPKLKKWLQEVNAATTSVENILQVLQEEHQLHVTPRSFYQFIIEELEQKVTLRPPNLLHHNWIISSSTHFLSPRRHAILIELKQIAKSLNCLLSRAVTFGLQIDMIDSMDPNQDDYYSILQQEMVERDGDVNKILHIIFSLQEGQPSWEINDDVPFVIAITGNLGIGKSVVARMLYHHPLVREVFKYRFWVDVSNCALLSFDHKQIARECARHLTGRISSDISDAWELIGRSHSQIRYLLVLDGVREMTMKDKDKWEKFKMYLLSSSAPGSRVIISCQFYNIIGIDQMEYPDRVYKLDDISHEAKTKLFLRYLMRHGQSKQISSSIGMTSMLNLPNREIEPIHSPFQAKILGLMSAYFKVSCENLPMKGQICYKSMTMHYDAHAFTQLYRYIALFRPLSLSFSKDCFDMLIVEGTFTYSRKAQQEFQKNINGMIKSYDIVETSDRISFDFYKNVHHIGKKSGQGSTIPQQCRYLSMLIESDSHTFLSGLQASSPDNLRTLILYGVKEEQDLHVEKFQVAPSIEIPDSLIRSLTILSIIDIGIQQLPNSICTLLCLRYLKISEKEIEELPDSICDLHNLCVLNLSHCKKLLKLTEQIHNLGKLQMLKLDCCSRLQKLPESITRLRNLQVLDVEACHWLNKLPEDFMELDTLINLNMIGCASLTKMPYGIQFLTNLEALLGYNVEVSDKIHWFLLLTNNLKNIEELYIRHLERTSTLYPVIAGFVMLKGYQYLEKLVLHWEWWNMDSKVDEQLESFKVLQGLQPNLSHLESFEIVSYMGMKFPNWMQTIELLPGIENLLELRLINLKRCNNISLLCQLPCLTALEISGMDSLTNVGDSTLPRLEELTLSEMSILEEWKFCCPSLQKLILIHCPKLVRLVAFKQRFKLTIWLESMILEQYSTSFQYIFKNIEELELVGCHKLRCLPQDIVHCENLQTLSIIRCNKLLSVPKWLHKITSMKQISVCGCTKISHVSRKLKLR